MHNIYNYWKNNPNLWFNSTEDDDKYISETFMTYLHDEYNINDMFIEESYLIEYFCRS